MTEQALRITSALACEDLRRDQDGKIIAIGILTPTIGLKVSSKVKSVSEIDPLRFHFLLTVDFLRAGDLDLRFRLKRGRAITGSTRRLSISVIEPEKNAPLPIGPFSIRPRPGDEELVLQHSVEGKWRRIATWRIEPPIPEITNEEPARGA